MSPSPEPTILDVRHPEEKNSISAAISALRTQILSGLLNKGHGKKTLPTMLLYDERGLRLYDELTSHAKDYYLFGCEEEILAQRNKDIVRTMIKDNEEGPVVVELGAGSLRKTSHILHALAQSPTSSSTTYFALDLEKRELLRTLSNVSSTIGEELKAGGVETKGMWGTYDGGLAFIRNGGLTKLAALELQGEEEGKATPMPHGQNQSGGGVSFKLPSFLDSKADIEDEAAPPIVHRTSSPIPSEPESASAQDDSATIPSTRTPPTSHHEPEFKVTPPEDDAEEEKVSQPPLHFMFLGSSLGNFDRADAVEFLKGLPLRPGSGDTLLLGLDRRNSPELIKLAYNDSLGYTTAFQMNGLRVAERIIQGKGDAVHEDWEGAIFDKNGWEYINDYNEVEGRHEGYYRSTKQQTVVIPPDIDRPEEPVRHIDFEEGELVQFEYSYKYSTAEALHLFTASNLRVVNCWTDSQSLYNVWLLERPPLAFPLVKPSPPSTMSTSLSPSSGPLPAVPTLAEWSTLWQLWDTITLGMIPPSMLHTKPIDLRHKCLFYLGHIPTFLDIHLTRKGVPVKGMGHTEPEEYKDIFERGIDPHVDDPSQIHPHSEVPDRDEDWPALDEVLAFRDRVRARLVRVYEECGKGGSVVRDFERSLGRVLWMTWEHEAFHAETLLYMLIQKAGDEDGTVAPPGFSKPEWEAVYSSNSSWNAPITPSPTITLGPRTLFIGHDDIEADDNKHSSSLGHEFGWDNESPRREVRVKGHVKVETRPVLNGEYFDWWTTQGKEDIPALWARGQNGEIMARTVFGHVPLSTVARNWPFIGSYDELNAFAKSKGGRLPTEAELRLFMDECYEGDEETNVGFRNWHPIPPKVPLGPGSKGHNGGVWEWTSTTFDEYEGFAKSKLYPGYSSDFFDNKHQVVLGGSWATVPRLAQRRSLRNWYQHNYPYAWVGGRVVYDV